MTHPLLESLFCNNVEMIKLLIILISIITLELNKKECGHGIIYPVLLAISRNKEEIVKLLIKYYNDHNVIWNIYYTISKALYIVPLLSSNKTILRIVQSLINTTLLRCVAKIDISIIYLLH